MLTELQQVTVIIMQETKDEWMERHLIKKGKQPGVKYLEGKIKHSVELQSKWECFNTFYNIITAVLALEHTTL